MFRYAVWLRPTIPAAITSSVLEEWIHLYTGARWETRATSSDDELLSCCLLTCTMQTADAATPFICEPTHHTSTRVPPTRTPLTTAQDLTILEARRVEHQRLTASRRPSDSECTDHHRACIGGHRQQLLPPGLPRQGRPRSGDHGEVLPRPQVLVRTPPLPSASPDQAAARTATGRAPT